MSTSSDRTRAESASLLRIRNAVGPQERALAHGRALLELNNAIITSRTLEQLLHATSGALQDLVSHDRAAMALYDPEAHDLRVYVLLGIRSPEKLLVGHLLGMAGDAQHEPFDFRVPLCRGDLQQERRFAFDEGLLAAGIRSHCALPLFAAGRAIGILGIGSKEPNHYSAEDFAFLLDVARQIALAVSNAQAYEEIATLKERLEEENQYLRRELIVNISHDLRSPLASLRGYLETLLLRGGALTPEKRNEYLRIAARQSEHLGTLVTQLFELAKLDFKGYQLSNEPFQLRELVQDIMQNFQLAAEEKSITLELDVPAVLPFVDGDIGLIERAFENLLENALKHTEQGGRIRLSVTAHENEVAVEVRDSGTGIAASDLPHVFERFYRARHARVIDAGGAGLGLAIVKRILDLHRCDIKVDSIAGEGTTFSFALPRAKPSKQQLHSIG